MELGLALEDEDMGQTRDRSNIPTLTSFNAKVCSPLVSTSTTVWERRGQVFFPLFWQTNFVESHDMRNTPNNSETISIRYTVGTWLRMCP